MEWNEQERVRLERHLYLIGLGLAGMAFLAVRLLPLELLARLQSPCMFHAITGFYCPGCGGTRAVVVLAKGNGLLSFCYHPIVLYFAALYIWFMASHTIGKLTRGKWDIGMRYRNAYLWMALWLVALNFVVKNVMLAAFDLDILQLLDAHNPI